MLKMCFPFKCKFHADANVALEGVKLENLQMSVFQCR